MNIPLGFLLVFLGSGLGGALRHGIGLASLRLLGPSFPYGTLLINVAGSALMGLAIGLFASRSPGSADLRLFVTTGILGGFTTWSTFSLDAVTLWERGQTLAAFGYVGGSLVVSLAVIALMLVVARGWG